jgi:sec-independent protein translocase protein TatC
MTDPTTPGSAYAADEAFVGERDDDNDRSRMTFLEHLDELRRRLIYSAYALAACCAVTFYFWKPIYLYAVTYFNAFGGQLIFNQPMSGFMFSLKLSALVGLVAASPFLFSQLWLFVAPGLYAREKKVVVPFVLLSTALFGGGAWFAHQIAFPSMLQFFASYEMGGMKYFPTLETIFGFYVKVVLGLGLIFQMPILVFFLARFGMLTAGFMLRKFKYAVLIIFVVAAIITPTGDPVNLMVFAAPMFLLYLVSIGVAWMFAKKKRGTDDPDERA